MKKLFKLFVLLIILVIAAVVLVYFSIDRIAKTAVEKGGTYALGVNTTLGSAHVGILTGEFSMSNLNVANPTGFKTSHFMNLKDGGVAVSLGTLTKDTVELPLLKLDGIDLNLEKKDGLSNYNVILENLKKLESGESQPKKEGGKKFVIRKVQISNVNVHVDVIPIGGQTTKLDVPIVEITLKDVGSDGSGVNMGELMGVLTKAIFAAVLQKGGGLIPADMAGELGKGLASLGGVGKFGIEVAGKSLEGVGQAAGEALKGVGDIGKGAGDATKGVGDALKGIGDVFGGKDKKKEEPK